MAKCGGESSKASVPAVVCPESNLFYSDRIEFRAKGYCLPTYRGSTVVVDKYQDEKKLQISPNY